MTEKLTEHLEQDAPINFTALIFSFSTSALISMGEMPNPESNSSEKDFHLAKHNIDILDMLKEKTKGNLNEEEEVLLTKVLYDLKLKYCKLVHCKK